MKVHPKKSQLIFAASMLAVVLVIGIAGMIRTAYRGTPVDYFCEEGVVLRAKYLNDSITVLTPDGSSFKLPGAVSASGARYEQDGVVFWSKGDQAFMTIMNQAKNKLYNNCVSGAVSTNKKGKSVFADTAGTFLFSYPSNFYIYGGEIGFTENWSTARSMPTSGLLKLTIEAPQNFKPHTNLREVRFTIGSSSDENALASCLQAEDPGVKKQEMVINGIPYTRLTFGDAGAGNFYDTTSYRTIHDGQCYAFEYTIHSLNIGNFPEEQHIEEFNKGDVSRDFEGIINSFIFQ